MTSTAIRFPAQGLAPWLLACLAAAACAAGAARGAAAKGIRLSDSEAAEIGRKVWQNEGGGKVSALTHWNQGEEFASLGIGHFIWYPPGPKGPFQESFPPLLEFLAASGRELPLWLQGGPECPWKTREAFVADKESPRMVELRDLLADTIALQARFIANRLEQALPKMLESLPAEQRSAISAQFYRVAGHPQGVYALVDYVNFKGEGVSPAERYKGQGWGLLQVLEGMTGTSTGAPALDEFAESADKALTRRVANSPPERNEARWLPVWRRRLATYRLTIPL